ncbi:gliding motility-associated C-terminal domain-containing protein [Halosquirtibacter xylanolyticus]|uniref:gliding motility-associated C-terminal domain-containing protein n=1 Tax=Halosquirtibacter xylanolyticus TaxID=3374599 RepID=UPI003749D75A|nr:gliding motility-associated C-terminal domain-containing protein [Prolixibacteraceae bacterium]
MNSRPNKILLLLTIVFLVCQGGKAQTKTFIQGEPIKFSLIEKDKWTYEWCIENSVGAISKLASITSESGIIPFTEVGTYKIHARGIDSHGCYSDWITKSFNIINGTVGVEDHLVLYENTLESFDLSINDQYLPKSSEYEWMTISRSSYSISRRGKVDISSKPFNYAEVIKYKLNKSHKKEPLVIIQRQPSDFTKNILVCNNESYILRSSGGVKGTVSNNDYSTFGHKLSYHGVTKKTKIGNAVHMDEKGSFEYIGTNKITGYDSFNYHVTDLYSGIIRRGTCYIYPQQTNDICLDNIYYIHTHNNIEGDVSVNDQIKTKSFKKLTQEKYGKLIVQENGHFNYTTKQTSGFIDKIILETKVDGKSIKSRCYFISTPKHENFKSIGLESNVTCAPYDEPIEVTLFNLQKETYYELFDGQHQPFTPNLTVFSKDGKDKQVSIPTIGRQTPEEIIVEAYHPNISTREEVGVHRFKRHPSLDFNTNVTTDINNSNIVFEFQSLHDIKSHYSIFDAPFDGALIGETDKEFINILSTTIHGEKVYIQSNDKLCSSPLKMVNIDISSLLEIKPFNTITPNNDGKNDTWIIRNIERYPENNVHIFNRWGDQIASFSNYNNQSVVWKGISKNKNLVTDGTFYYMIEVPNYPPLKGWIYVRGGRDDI